jgi:hypothetical protein
VTVKPLALALMREPLVFVALKYLVLIITILFTFSETGQARYVYKLAKISPLTLAINKG